MLKEPQKWAVRGFSGRTVRSGPGFITMKKKTLPLPLLTEASFLCSHFFFFPYSHQKFSCSQQISLITSLFNLIQTYWIFHVSSSPKTHQLPFLEDVDHIRDYEVWIWIYLCHLVSTYGSGCSPSKWEVKTYFPWPLLPHIVLMIWFKCWLLLL